MIGTGLPVNLHVSTKKFINNATALDNYKFVDIIGTNILYNNLKPSPQITNIFKDYL